MQQHAYVIGGGVEEGISRAEAFIQEELGMKLQGNPDVVILRYGMLSVEEARTISGIAAQGAIAGDTKAIVIAAGRVYGDAQNALLKIFEEPPRGTYLFLVLPSLGGLLPTLKSRVAVLTLRPGPGSPRIPEVAQEFLAMSKEKRSAYIQKLAKGKDEEERREHRDEALALVNGLELAAYVRLKERIPSEAREETAFLGDLGILRTYLHAPSAPVRMILEHISLTLPSRLL
jgi:DNA polymerase III delta prime subunit